MNKFEQVYTDGHRVSLAGGGAGPGGVTMSDVGVGFSPRFYS